MQWAIQTFSLILSKFRPLKIITLPSRYPIFSFNNRDFNLFIGTNNAGLLFKKDFTLMQLIKLMKLLNHFQ